MKDLHHPNRSTNAFTLIELLIVIAIIAILAAILFPVFARARENARRAACQSNLKQIALAFHQYSQDFDERLPPYSGVADVTDRSLYSTLATQGWAVLLDPYLKSDQIFQCPSDNTKAGAVTTGAYNDYIYNANICYTAGVLPGNIQPAKYTHISEFASSASTIMVLDAPTTGALPYGSSFFYMDQSGFPLYLDDTSTNPTLIAYSKAARRHLEGCNYCFADGHVKWFRPTMITASATPSGANFTFKLK